MPVIRDVMSDRVVAVPGEATLYEAASILCEHSVSGAPVVSQAGELLGLIAESSLVDILFDEDTRTAPVTDYMNRDVHPVGPEDSLAEAARLLALFGIRRLPVVNKGTIVGIVTRRDLLEYAVESGELLADPLVELIPWLAPAT